MKTLTADTQRCKPPVTGPLDALPRAFTVPVEDLTPDELEHARRFCWECRSFETCRDFAYVTRMAGFVAGATDADRAGARDRARQYVSQERIAAHAAGDPFPHTERDRVYRAALKGAHLMRVLGTHESAPMGGAA